MSRELITVKGTRNGLVFYFNTKDAAFKEIEDTLVEKFQNAKGFFSQARFMISPENDLTEEQIKAIEEICLHHGMTKSSVGPGTPKYDGSLQRRVDQDTKVSDPGKKYMLPDIASSGETSIPERTLRRPEVSS